MKVLDLFCGCGGFSLGFEMAGFEIKYSNIGFNTTHQENLMRVQFLQERNIDVFVMPFNKLDSYQRTFARWVNRHYYKYESWEQYLSKKTISIEV